MYKLKLQDNLALFPGFPLTPMKISFLSEENNCSNTTP